jgi:dihydrolipoamide dehydrogenase
VTINRSDKIHARAVIVATGSTPVIPPRFDIDRTRVMTSNEILRLGTLPESILIVGGGYIGCEYASIFSNYGVEITLVELLPKILNTEDDDVVNEIVRSFRRRGITVLTNTALDAVDLIGNKVRAVLSNGCSVTADIALVAVGRNPNTRGLGLDELGIQLNKQGAIGVNERFRTSRNDVYAIGDVIDRELRLAHVSEKEGIVGIDNILQCAHDGRMSYDVIPTAIFVEPEIASVGKREWQLNKEGIEYIVGKSWYARNAMAQCSGNTAGFVKLISDKSAHKILGGTIVGSHAADMIGTIATAMNADTTMRTLADSVWFHPSRPEAIKEAAGAVLSKCKINDAGLKRNAE